MTQQGQNSKTRVMPERDAYGELDESRDPVGLIHRADGEGPYGHRGKVPILPAAYMKESAPKEPIRSLGSLVAADS